MGVTGHIGIAFDPADEAVAIAAVNGEHDGDDWVRHHTKFGLVREDFWDLHLVLGKLAEADSSLAQLATAVMGSRAVGEGPTHPMCLYTADEVRQIAGDFTRVSDAALEEAIGEVQRERAWQGPVPLQTYLPEIFHHVGREFATVAANRWSLIAFMF